MNYYEVLSLSNIYLEDSYVLSIDEFADALTFELEAVLTKDHPQYQEPKKGERYCYRRVSLRFFCVSSIEWLEKHHLKFKDSTGDFDHGNNRQFR